MMSSDNLQQYQNQTNAFLRRLSQNPIVALKNYPVGCRTEQGRDAYRQAAFQHPAEAVGALTKYLAGYGDQEALLWAAKLLSELQAKQRAVMESNAALQRPSSQTPEYLDNPKESIQDRRAQSLLTRDIERLVGTLLSCDQNESSMAQENLLVLCNNPHALNMIRLSFVRRVAEWNAPVDLQQFPLLLFVLGGESEIRQQIGHYKTRNPQNVANRNSAPAALDEEITWVDEVQRNAIKKHVDIPLP